LSIVTAIFKKLLPRTFLKRVFLVYNGIKARTLDKLLYKEERIEHSMYQEFREKNPFLELRIDTVNYELDVQDKLAIWQDTAWTQDQYVLLFKNGGYIEPRTGWGVSNSYRLIYPSLGFSRAPYVYKPGFFSVRMGKSSVVQFSKIISLRDTGEENYFHFYNDIIPKLYLLEERGVDLSAYDLVIGDKLFHKPYFQYFLMRSNFAHLRWYPQKNCVVSFDEAIFCKPFTHTKSYLTRTAKTMLGGMSSPASRRIFLTRSSTSLRYVENAEELYPILTRFGFEVVDTADLTIEAQIRIFLECRYLVAVHGAGTSNVIFRNGMPLDVLEILHPSPYLPFHYIMICKLFGYSYDVLLGQKGGNSHNGGFRIDPGKFERRVVAMLTEPEQ